MTGSVPGKEGMKVVGTCQGIGGVQDTWPQKAMVGCTNRGVPGGWSTGYKRSGGKWERSKVKPDVKKVAGLSFKEIKHINLLHIITV